MNNYRDEYIEKKISEIKEELKNRRDNSPANSDKRQYYRKLSKQFDKIGNKNDK